MKTDCLILAAPKDCHTLYDAHQLNLADLQRIEQNPHLAKRLDWQSSRFLKQQLPKNHTQLSISHKKGHAALIASCQPQDTLGIDLEYAQTRDFLALASLCCSTIEQQWLAIQADVQQAFYQLWTLKEALIKAHHGQLTDMPSWGLVPHVQTGIQIPMLKQALQAHTTVIDKHWYLSVVYPEQSLQTPQDMFRGFSHWQNLRPIWQAWPAAMIEQ